MNNLSGSLSFHGNVSGQMGADLIPSVEANPSGTATEILTSIRVGNIIYSIPSGGGGGGGTNDYNSLLNKPKINNVELSGEKSLTDLGIYNPVTMTGATSSEDGAAGYAPKPLKADKNKFLKGDGTWSPVSSSGVTIDTLIDESNGVTIDTIYTFLNDRKLSDYTFIELLIATHENVSSNLGYDRWLMSTHALISNPIINYGAYGQRWFYAEFTDTTFKQINTSGDQYPYVYKIIGIKFDS